MPVSLLFLEFLGTTELIVIAAVALLVFGPRKLPEIGRTIGRSLAEFKRASEDFKRTWEYEVDMERSDRETRVEPAGAAAPAALPEGEAAAVNTGEGGDNGLAPAAAEEPTVARAPTDYSTGPAAEVEEPSVEESSASGGKKDWL